MRSAHLAQRRLAVSAERLKADAAASNDPGYTYGRYESREEDARAGETALAEKGYYVRIWKRDRKGASKIVLDTTHPLPPAEK